VSIVYADGLPVVFLDEGNNNVEFIVSNKYFMDLNNLNIVTDTSNLPVWIDIQLNKTDITVFKGEKSGSKIDLNFRVENAPSNAETIVPLILQDDKGNRWDFSVKICANSTLPLMNFLENNFPNPFNPSTTINYYLKDNVHTKLVIYNTLGQKVRTLVDEQKAAGFYSVKWDGKNENGQMVSSGVYFYKFKAGNFVKTQKMMLLE